MSRPYRFTGVGSVLIGGRWSVKGLMPAVYASMDLATLTHEAYYKCQRYGWVPEQFQPQLAVHMRWEFLRVLDLTSPETLRALNVTKQAVLGCDWHGEQWLGREPLTQAIGRAAFESLAEALVVPSARHRSGVNLVYYPTHRRAGTRIQTLGEEEIPWMHGL